MNKALQTLIDRGFVKACTDYDALSDLMDAGPVTFYVGADPTGKSFILVIWCRFLPCTIYRTQVITLSHLSEVELL